MIFRKYIGLIMVVASLPLLCLRAQPCAPTVNLGADISFCQGNSLSLNAHFPGAIYLWNTGATTSSINVTTGGTYWVRVSNSCGVDTDTIEIYTDPPLNINLGPNRPLCGSNSLSLSAPANNRYTYLWSDGSTANSLVVSTPGSYWVRVSNACGTFRDTVQILPAVPNSFSLGPDLFPCNANNVSLGIPANINGTFRWSTGQTTRNITAYSPGYYWARVTSPCGTLTDTIYVQPANKINHGFPDTVYFCPGGSTTLSSSMQGTFSWSTGSNSNAITITQPGVYTLTFTHACGTKLDTIVAVQRSSPVVNLGPDTTACFYLELNANNPGATFVWSNGSTRQKQTINKSGIYWVQVQSSCGLGYDTIQVEIKKPPGDSIADSIGYCPGSHQIVYAGYYPNGQYLWSNSDTTSSSSYDTTGWHNVSITNFCGTYVDSFYLKPDRHLNFELSDTSFCDSASVYFKVPGKSTTDSIYWSTGSTQDSVSIVQSGLYWVTVFNTCDTLTDFFRVTVNAMPERLKDTAAFKCMSGNVIIGPVPKNSINYLWSTTDSTARIIVSDTGAYWLMMYNDCDTIIDTVNVYMDSMPQLNLPSHIYVCLPNTVAARLPYERGARFFVNGQRISNPALTVTQSGQYIVEFQNSCGSAFDTVQVTVTNEVKALLNNQSFCSGGSVTLNASQTQATTYLWNTGATTSGITVNQGGWYFVDISNQCSAVRDSVYVLEQFTLPPINLGNDTIFCQGQLHLDPGYFQGADYTWQNGSKSTTFNAWQSGTYYVTISNTCNTVTDTIEVLITGPPQAVLGTEIRYCATHNFYIDAHNPGCTYLWNTGDTTQSLLVSQPGLYWVTISNDCGTITDSVFARPDYPLVNLNLGYDTIICKGQSLLLDPETGDAKLTWSTGLTDSTLIVTTTGLYWLEAENRCGFFYDSIYVLVEDIPVFDHPDTAICYTNDSITLKGPPNMTRYLWNTGHNGKNLRISSASTYFLRVWNQCFSYTDTIKVINQYPIEFNLPDDTAQCEYQQMVLDLSHVLHPVIWSDGHRGKQRVIRKSGKYVATSKNRCGLFSDTIQVDIHYDLSDSTQEVWLCREDTFWVDFSDRPYQYLWPDGSTASRRALYQESEVYLQIINLCGMSNHLFKVEVSNCECPIYTADAFTPNGDGLNDYFRPVHSCDFTSFRMRIFTRWGQIIFETTDAEKGWDGTVQGKPLSQGTYIYQINYGWRVYDIPQQDEVQGQFTLMR